MSAFVHTRRRSVASAPILGKGIRTAGGWLFAEEDTTQITRVRQWTGSAYSAHDDPLVIGGTIRDLAWFSATDIWLLFNWGVCHWDGSAWAEVVTDPTYSEDFEALAGTSSSDLYIISLLSATNNVVRYYYWDGATMSGPTTVTYGATVKGSASTAATYPAGGIVRVAGRQIVTLTGTPASEFVASGDEGRIWAPSSSSTWAVLRRPLTTGGTPGDTVLYNGGSGWAYLSSQPPYPGAGIESWFLYAIHGTSDTDVWIAGGADLAPSTPTFAPLVWHWDGSTWTRHTLAAGTLGLLQEINDIHAEASNDVWATGYSTNADGSHTVRAYHWDGSTWTDRSPTS